MTRRFSMIIFLLLAVFASLGYSQPTAPKFTTEETAQIVYVDTAGTLDAIKLVSPTREVIDKDYLRTYKDDAGQKTYFLTVNLGFGANDFVVVIFIKGGAPVSTPITIKRLQADTIPGSPVAVPSPSVNPSAATSQQSPTKIPLRVATPQSILTPVPVAYFGPTTGDAAPNAPLSGPSSTGTIAPLAENFVRVGRTAPGAPVPAPSPSSEQKAKDSENKNIPINPNLRLIFGFEQVGASSSTSKGRPFADLLLNIPVGQFKVDYKDELRKNCVPELKDDCRVPIKRYFSNSFWTSLRLTSSPTQTLPDLGGLTSTAISGFFGSNQSNQINDLVQSFDMKIGWETTVRKGFSLIAGVGATSPLSSEKTVIGYKIPRQADGKVQPEFKKIFGPNQDFDSATNPITNLILTSGDRDRFMRNWFVGGRLRYQLVGKPADVYPAVFELTFGQDEVMTNKLVGRVLKFDSFVPIPVKGLEFLYFGTSFSAKLTRKVNTTTFPFFLEPAAAGLNIFANTNLVRNIRDIKELNSDRDGFSFRFGVDLARLLNKPDGAKTATTTPAAPIKKPGF